MCYTEGMGKLYFRYGAMGCGKTIHLLQSAFNYEERGQKVCVAKPAIDTKNGTKLLTRIGLERKTNFVFPKEENLFKKIEGEYGGVDCILIDEAQFMTPKQVDQLMIVVVKLGIPVMCYGLRLNFRLEDGGFEGATRLLQVAHDVSEIKTICECGHKAMLNARFLDGKLVVDGPDVLIDGESEVEYRALCPKCFQEYLEKQD